MSNVGRERPRLTATPPKSVNIRKLLADIPDVATLEAVCNTSPLAGRSLRVNWNGEWEADVDNVYRLDSIPRELLATTPLGDLTLSNVLATSIGHGFSKVSEELAEVSHHLSGVSTNAAIRRTPAPDPSLFRCYVSCDERFGRIAYPEALEDEAREHTWFGLLPLELDGEAMDAFFLKEGPYMVFEGRRASLAAFERHVGAARVMLTYLTALPLEGRSCQLVLPPDDGQPVECHWNGGWGSQEPSIHSPIPIGWTAAGWYHASRRLPLEGKVLIPSIMSACVQKLLDEPLLDTPLGYIRLALDSPVEIRGALLSVALESFTDHFQKQKRIHVPPPVDESSWQALETDLIAAVNLRATSWPAETREAAKSTLLSRIDRLNQPTNRSKLQAPFDAYGLSLTAEQAKAIDSRNRLLHSGRLVSRKNAPHAAQAWREAFVLEMHLYTAINKLLLSHLGYRGPIYDWGAAGFDRIAESCFTEI